MDAESVVARSADLPRPGDFVTVEHAGLPLLVVRQDDGSVRALVNICRHRGAKVELRTSGTRKLFNCPYHKWCYTRSGALRHIPYDDGFAEIDRADYALREYPVEERDGFVVARVPVPVSVGAEAGEQLGR